MITNSIREGEDPHRGDGATFGVSLVIPYKISSGAKLEELFDPGVKHSFEIRKILGA